MQFPRKFIAAATECCTFENYVPAPMLRRAFRLDNTAESAKIIICGLGFYELYINGNKLNNPLAPYISAPDDIVYYNEYDVAKYLRTGENIIGVVLGNGMQNAFGGYIWDFDKAAWRGAPKMAMRLEVSETGGGILTIESDTQFKTSPSPIYFDDLRCGEYYDARMEQAGWNMPGFDDSAWSQAVPASVPRGEPRFCEAEPIAVSQRIKPVKIFKENNAYIYDFGINHAGVCTLRIEGEAGQKISMRHGEYYDGQAMGNLIFSFEPEGFAQKNIYICKGGGEELYTPRFTYHGFRYVRVEGINEEQAVSSLLTFLVMHSALEERGGFSCSDSTVNTLQAAVRRSTLANFYYFPTDCPHREKNGWTGDAAISAEHTLLNLAPEKSYKEWLRNIRKTQKEHGQLPGIIPTGGWGYHWGNGPAWDCVLTYLPYYTYVYRGDMDILRENAAAIFRYVHYLSTSRNSDGLIELGLGDWCPPSRKPADYDAPLVVTDSIISMDICRKAVFIFKTLGWADEKAYAGDIAQQLFYAIREKCVDFKTMLVRGNCQTSQAMALHYGIFFLNERQVAFNRLLHMIEEKDGHMDTGILGARVIFHVLSAFGESDLAFKMITREDYPSYGNWLKRGATSFWENFNEDEEQIWSRNHHFFGDISSWFIKCIAGIRYNPTGANSRETDIMPSFIGALERARGYHITPHGNITAEWERNGETVTLRVSVPKGFTGKIKAIGWVSENGEEQIPLNSGVYQFTRDQSQV